MTCEIAIMNRQAIALAADSATTVTQWIDGKQEQRFFKGTNKIFQLSNEQPVGVMIFGSATLHEVPWELIIKEFRRHLADKSFNDLSGYAGEFFDYVKGHSVLFPHEYQIIVFKQEVQKMVFLHLFLAGRTDAVKNASTDEEKQKAYHDYLSACLDAVDSAPATQFDQAEIEKILAAYRASSEADVRKTLTDLKLQGTIDPALFAQLVIKDLLKHYGKWMSSTGVVVAGFGENDYFPGYEEYECYGILLGQFLYDKRGAQKVNVDTASLIKPFATKAMINTFLTGFSPDVYAKIQEELEKALRAFGEKIKAQVNVNDIPNLPDLIQKTIEEHTDSWTNAALDAHAWPLRRIIGSLPVDEMAELAETLIMLESLKEKVTKPTESVGGPIDVAVISKGDGFVWIKRKHYFDPKLNPRFLLRQAGREK